MNHAPTTEQLQAALQLSKEKATLEKEIAKLQSQLQKVDEKILAALGGEVSVAKPAAKAAKPASAPKTRKPETAPRVKRGKLKEDILSALQAGGTDGVSLSDVCAATGHDPKKVSMWISANAPAHPEIQKVSRGVYKWVGDKSSPAPTPAPNKEDATTEENSSEFFPGDEPDGGEPEGGADESSED